MRQTDKMVVKEEGVRMNERDQIEKNCNCKKYTKGKFRNIMFVNL